MIKVRMNGRLGNQLFQYAFVRSLQKNNPELKSIYDFSKVYSKGNKEDGFDNSLKLFCVKDVVEDNKELKLTISQRIVRSLYYRNLPHNVTFQEKNLYQQKWLYWLAKMGLYYLDLGYYKFPPVLNNKNYIIDGYFESPKYFDAIRDELLEELVPIYPPLQKNRELYKKMEDTNSVCISVRRGDFISNLENSKIYNVCTEQYFNKAIAKIKELIPGATLFFFSDDISWVKENLCYDEECFYEDGTDPVWEKLRLMYSCKHFIISNSTFSWWAQYLGQHPNKIVIAPNRWYNNKFVPDIYEEHWKLIDVD